MSTPRQCEYCGQDLPWLAPEGLCPDCLLGIGAAEWGLEDAQRSKAKGDARQNENQSSAFEVSGQRLGSYTLLEKIGQGGMGVVYKARQVNLDRVVAVKLLPFGQFSRKEVMQRFRAEAAAVASLQHPNIIAIHDVGEHEGQPFFSMDFVEGRTLAELVQDQPLPARRAAAYLKTIAEAVDYAHRQGILHRDLKPSNVLIDALDQPRITDFGLAKRLDDSARGTVDSSVTLSGQVLGSPHFISPEQAEGRPERIGRPTDVYSLGALLYHLLTRQPPFQAETLTTLLKQVIETDPVPPRRFNPSIPADLETICLKCLEKEAGGRYPTAQALAEDLGRYLDEKPIHARPVGPPGKAWKWCRRRPALAALTGALLATIILGLVGVLWQWQRATRLARAELEQRQRAQAGEYAADMHLAQLALNNNNRALAVRLLGEHRPEGKAERRKQRAKSDLRGWEWRYLWQLSQGDELLTLHRYPRGINGLAVSQRRNLLVVTTTDEMAVWDLTSRTPLTTVPIGATVAAFSPADDLLAVGTRNAKGEPVVDFWDITAGAATRKRTLAQGNRSLSFSPDGQRVAIVDNRGKLTVADCSSDQPFIEFRLQPRRDGGGLVVFSPDGKQLAIGEEYGRLRLLYLQSGSNLVLRTETDAAINAAAFSPDARLLAAGIGYGQGTIRLWDAVSGEPRGCLTNHTGDISALAFTRDGQRLVSASRDGTIRLWSLADQSELRCFQTSGEGVSALALLEDGRTLVSGGTQGSLCFWDTTGSRPAAHTNLALSVGMEAMGMLEASDFAAETLAPSAARRFGMAFTSDSSSFITMSGDGGLALRDVRSFRQLESLPLGTNHWGVALSPDGHWLATGDASGRITLWDWTTRQEVTNFPVHFEWFGLLRFSPSSHYLMAAIPRNDHRFTVRIWRTETCEELPLSGSEFNGLWSVDVSPDDQLLAAGYGNGEVKLFRWPSRALEFTCTRHQGTVWAVCFSPDGRRVASSGFDGTARVWEVVSRREEAVLRGHSGMVLGMAFLPDGRRLVTGGSAARDAVKVWDLQTGRELLSLQAAGHYFVHLACSPDGNTLTATSFTGMAHFWHVPPWKDIAAAEKRQAPASRR